MKKTREAPPSVLGLGLVMQQRLDAWESEGFVLPGWQIVPSSGEAGTELIARLQLVHQQQPFDLAEEQFLAYVQGWEDRRRAVIARKPPQQPRRTSGSFRRG